MLPFVAKGLTLEIIVVKHVWILTACQRPSLVLPLYVSMSILRMDYWFQTIAKVRKVTSSCVL